jgi:hypothetical protein
MLQRRNGYETEIVRTSGLNEMGPGKRIVRVIKLVSIGLLMVMAAASLTPALAVESISVSCYLDNLYIGGVTVYDASTASDACNSLYYACRNSCSGCFTDFDYAEQVCVYTDGRIYLK